MEVLTLKKYKRIIRKYNRPTSEQIENFIEYLRQCHSWYKHLPLLPPGREFIFFIDPNAGMEILKYPDGQRLLSNIDWENYIPHYFKMPAVDYRKRFGRLEFLKNLRKLCKRKKRQFQHSYKYGFRYHPFKRRLRDLIGEERLDRLNAVDPDFKLLLKPEVDRLLNSIRTGITRVLDLIY
ncbi:MAG TPA: hypothetical protein ENO22_13985 [candidate division Zixibacteria bacterium]|nr:hypothetical protein [candidate division Zixibacteria bacterium]